MSVESRHSLDCVIERQMRRMKEQQQLGAQSRAAAAALRRVQEVAFR